jgi:hypothetical protein
LLEAAAEASRAGDVEQLVAAALANLAGFTAPAGVVDFECVAVVEEALVAVGDSDERARALLLGTLVAQLAFNRDLDRRMALVREAEDIARGLDDPSTLLRVLNLTSASLWVPHDIARSDRASQEAVALAIQVNDPSAHVVSLLMRRLVDASLTDRPSMDSAIGLVDRLADESGEPFHVWSAVHARSWYSLLGGEVGEAERLASESLTLGSDWGLPDAMNAFGALLANIRVHQGRAEEMLPLLAQAIADNPGIPAFQATYAVVLCECGDYETARPLLAAARDADFHRSAVDYTWLTAQAMWADTAAMVGDATAAQTLFDTLLPFASQGIATPVSFVGTINTYLARLASLLGRDDAVEFFERGDAQLRALGAPFWQARNEIEWARHLAHQGSDRHDHARALLTEAITTSREYGCAGLERRANELLVGLT